MPESTELKRPIRSRLSISQSDHRLDQSLPAVCADMKVMFLSSPGYVAIGRLVLYISCVPRQSSGSFRTMSRATTIFHTCQGNHQVTLGLSPRLPLYFLISLPQDSADGFWFPKATTISNISSLPKDSSGGFRHMSQW